MEFYQEREEEREKLFFFKVFDTLRSNRISVVLCSCERRGRRISLRVNFENS